MRTSSIMARYGSILSASRANVRDPSARVIWLVVWPRSSPAAWWNDPNVAPNLRIVAERTSLEMISGTSMPCVSASWMTSDE